MSVLIKGMEMPKNCYECPFGLLEYTSQCYGKTIRNKFACCITHKTKTSTKRNRFCPLVEIPKHGRLIDADALRAGMYHEAFETDSELQRWDSGCWVRYKMFENHMDNAPTIIEAEE